MLPLALSWPKQLTYPIERWPVPARLSNPEERERFFDAIHSARGIMGACKALGMARGSVRRYRDQNPEFESQLKKELEDLYHDLGFQAINIADKGREEATADTAYLAQFIRTQVDVRLRVRGYHKPQNVEVNVDNRQLNIHGVNDEERAKLIAARERALANNDESKKLTEGK